MTEKDNEPQQAPTRKLCSNCAYRATCNKRFSANVANGQVMCNEHAFDVVIMKKKLSTENE